MTKTGSGHLERRARDLARPTDSNLHLPHLTTHHHGDEGGYVTITNMPWPRRTSAYTTVRSMSRSQWTRHLPRSATPAPAAARSYCSVGS
ncbi:MULTISPECIES: hypothetical protein [Streptomyces]|uniref:Uncharacterized protein n=1 Tax=Streptomyces venezuelae TaxID=54571 RepID=A0A5P2B527_STRVZ|nr:hypothetical protein [Streptomyces venezuelae]QES24261.1 hypothetical protein DEJ46_38500 [Streptomyces venezuelae]